MTLPNNMKDNWILKDGETYFKSWTGIGPAGTKDVNEAERFESKQEAMQSPAFTFSLMSYEPIELT